MLAPIEADVDCTGGRHRLRCSDGALVALDHPDPDGERMLLALGGEPPACLDLLRAWEAHLDDLHILVLGPRHAGTGRAPIRRQSKRSARGTSRRASAAGGRACPGCLHSSATSSGEHAIEEMQEHLPRHIELLRLFTLPPEFPRRLSAMVAGAWCERDPGHPALQAALAGRAGHALRAWLGDGRSVEVRASSIDLPTAEISVEAATAVLSPTWLVDVWGPDLAVFDDEFVVEVAGPGAVRTVDRDGRHNTRRIQP